jgi:hypothetical protein
MPTYHLTVFPLAAWARKKIDKIRRSFLWKGEENANRGHCLVNWPTVLRPKDLGRLGISDLEKFGRALRLRWLWQDWVEDSKPWAGAELPCNVLDRLLFDASTKVTIGNGEKARFWHSNWLDSEAPRHLALLVKRKNISVQLELRNNSWIRLLSGRITTAIQVEEFVSPWIRIQNINLTPGVRDYIVWRWTADGTYSTKSTYRIQLRGSYVSFRSDLI